MIFHRGQKQRTDTFVYKSNFDERSLIIYDIIGDENFFFLMIFSYDLVILRFDYQDDFLVVFVLCPCGYNGVSSLKISDAKLAMRALH